MTSFLPNTHSEPLLKVLHRTLQHFLRQSCDFLTNGKFQIFDCSCSNRVHSRLGVSPQKSRKSIDQGNVGAKKHRRNGRSHVGGTCVYTFILSRFTKSHSQWSCKPQHRTFLRQRYETNTVTYSRQTDWQAAVTSVNILQKY